MTPEALRRRSAELREAGAALRARPAREVRARLAEWLDGWRDPGSKWRRELLDTLPAATGFSRPLVEEGLGRGLEPWSGEALHALVSAELGDAAEGDAFGLTSVLLAGSIPMPTLVSLLAPLAVRAPVLAKCASRDPVTPPLAARSLAEVDAGLGRCVAAVEIPSEDADGIAVLLEADCIAANGSDESVAAIAAQVVPPRRLVPHGHRLSLAAIGPDATRGVALREAATRAALDVALWDQLGCLSPIALLVADTDAAAADRVAEALAEALADAERRWPRGEIDAGSAARIASERAEAELRAADGRSVALWASEGTCWTVVREEDAEPRPAPLHRFVRVVPTHDASDLLQAVRPYARHLAGVGVAGFGESASRDLATRLHDLGATRVCALGELQSPPLDWPRDGMPVLTPLRPGGRDGLTPLRPGA